MKKKREEKYDAIEWIPSKEKPPEGSYEKAVEQHLRFLADLLAPIIYREIQAEQAARNAKPEGPPSPGPRASP